MNNNLIEIIHSSNPHKVIVLDVQAEESGALTILTDFFNQVRETKDKNVKWIFVLSKPELKCNNENIEVIRFPWVKKNWLCRLFFDVVILKKLIHEHRPDNIFSLQNKGVVGFRGNQEVYFHMAVYLTDYRFSLRRDGKKLWLYQNVLKGLVLNSLKHVNTIIVQTNWMKNALMKETNIANDKIIVRPPQINIDNIKSFAESESNYKRFFYPALPFTYKCHLVILKAAKVLNDLGICDFELFFTIRGDENPLACELKEYVDKYKLNVSFLGTITREQVFALYSTSVLVFPSGLESFGLPLLEAKLSGTPIISSDTDFAKEILDDYPKVSYFHGQDYHQLADIMKQIITACPKD